MSTMPAELMRMIAGAMDSDDSNEAPGNPAIANTPESLGEAFSAITDVQRFKPGDVVAWKKLPCGGSLKNRRNPQINDTAVVFEHLATPLTIEEDNAGTAYFREPLDLIVGCFDKDGDFLILHLDSRRFEAANTPNAELAALMARLMQKNTFTPGMLVTWKPGLRNKKLPRPGEPLIVQEMLDAPQFDKQSRSGSPYYREPYDLIGGLLDSDGEYVAYHYDSRRFMPYTLPEASPVKRPKATAADSKPKGRRRDVIA